MHDIPYIQIKNPVIFLLCHKNSFYIIFKFYVVLLIPRVKSCKSRWLLFLTVSAGWGQRSVHSFSWINLFFLIILIG